MRVRLTEKIVAICMGLSAAMAANAAPTYSLKCETTRGQSFTFALSSFRFRVSSTSTASTGMATGKRSTSELVFRFPASKEYDTLLAAVEDDEVLRSCQLTETTGTVAATDNWNMKTNSKVKGSKNNSASSESASGAMEWTFNNATISSLTAIGTDGSGAAGTAGATPEALVEGTIVAQNFTFVTK